MLRFTDIVPLKANNSYCSCQPREEKDGDVVALHQSICQSYL